MDNRTSMYKGLVICFLLGFSAPMFSQTRDAFIGSWEGRLRFQTELRIVIHIKAIGQDGVLSTLDSPDQSVFGIVADTTTIRDGELHFAIKRMLVSFTGKLENDSSIAGGFTQTATIPLTLKKTTGQAAVLNRPQTPKPPFPYATEDIEYDNAAKTVHFGATLSFPNTGGPFVTAVLITGSGQQDRDETMMGHKPFAVIADYLTRNGFAVLRIDDRGRGKTTGEVMKASSADFADDISTAIDYLKTRKEVNPKKIGLIGHSEGGLIASTVITKRKDVAFIISLAGAGMKGADILADQGEVIMVKAGIDSQTARSYHDFYRKLIGHTLVEKDSAACFNITWQDFDAWRKTMKQGQLNQLGFVNDSIARTTLRSLIEALYMPWLHYFNESDASLNYQKAYCPVLALNGSEDVQVIAKKNLPGIETALKKAGLKNYEVKELPGLNHLFQHCKKCTLAEYGELEETFAPEVLEIMKTWLAANFN